MLLDILIFIAVASVIAHWSRRRKTKALLAAPVGATRVECAKAHRIQNVINLYANCGWTVEHQTSAKSFGSQPRVTLTFRKAHA